MQRRRVVQLLAAAAAATAPLPASVRRVAAAEPLKVGFLYVGPVGDFGWSYQHDAARKAAAEKFGGAIATSYVDSIKEGPECEKIMADMAGSGHRLIFATSFGFMDGAMRAATRFPQVRFEHCTGYKRTDNLATYNIRFYQGRYVQGVIAGHVSKSGVAGYVGAVAVPEVVQGLNAFMLGMRSVNPKARLKFIMVNSWYDPPKEGDAAKTLIDQGCDVIAQNTDSPAPLQAAAGRGVKAFGQDADMRRFAENAQLTANVDQWAPYYIKRIGEALAGTWSSTDTWGGFADGMLAMAPFANMPDAAARAASAAVADITAGRNKVFVGPLTDQSGTARLTAGEAMDDASLNQMNWLVPGIEGKLG